MKPRKKILENIGILASIITAICALLSLYLIVNAVDSLKETKIANQEDFILNLNNQFYFNDRLTRIRTAIETNNKVLIENGGSISDIEMDDYIGFFDTLSSLLEANPKDYQLIDQNYGYYIKEAYDNKEIQSYITFVHQKYGKDVYRGFEDLGSRISKEGY